MSVSAPLIEVGNPLAAVDFLKRATQNEMSGSGQLLRDLEFVLAVPAGDREPECAPIRRKFRHFRNPANVIHGSLSHRLDAPASECVSFKTNCPQCSAGERGGR